MIIQRTVSGAAAHLKISGAIDDANAPEFSSCLADLTQAECQNVTLDLTDVPRMCSAAIGSLMLLFRCQRRLGRQAKIEGIHPHLESLFGQLQLSEQFGMLEA